MVKEYVIKYRCGTSPFCYMRSVYAESEKEALEYFLKNEAPSNLIDYEVAKAMPIR